LRRVEREVRFDRARERRERAHQAHVEGGVGHHVEQAGSGGQHAMFDPYVRRAVAVEADQRSVPVPEGAVVQPQMREA
jgi:hypothetical protein